MALVLADRVQQTGTANTTVSFTLSGSVTGYQSFAVVGNGNTTYYSSTDASGNWEVGLGTYSTTGPTLTRTTILASSNAGAAVTFSGTVTVFVVYAASKSVNLDGSGNVTALGTVSSGTWQATAVGLAYGGSGQTTAQAAMNAFAGAVTNAQYLRGNGTNVVMSAIQASDVPTLNQNTTGSAGSVTNALTINNGGAGAASGTTYNGSAAVTVSYNTVGAPSTTGTNASGTWGISITGNAATATSATSATSATTATNATNLTTTDDTTTNATYYPTFQTATGGTNPLKTSSTKLTYNPSTGTLTSTVLTASSDETLKANWQDLPDLIAGMAGVKNGEFDWIDGSGSDVGVSAQSLLNVLALAVKTGEDGKLAVNYGAAALVTCIQLCKRVLALEAEVQNLKKGAV